MSSSIMSVQRPLADSQGSSGTMVALSDAQAEFRPDAETEEGTGLAWPRVPCASGAPHPHQASRLSISAWYAISGTAMA